MSKIYGKMWAEGNPGKMSTRQGHQRLTIQLLYGSKSDSRIAMEATVTVCEHGNFRLKLNIPEDKNLSQRIYHLPFDN